MGKNDRKYRTVQDFIGIQRIENGVIETADQRYIRILEITPTHFLLRADEEQRTILSAFAAWLKIAPVRLQFKCITERADSEQYIKPLQNTLEVEENENCKRLGEEQIRLIRSLSEKEALTRRFFLIFSYEPLHRGTEDYDAICAILQNAEETARSYLAQCGNTVLVQDDPDEATAEMLYRFFNRRTSLQEPFVSRVRRVVMDDMAAKHLTVGIDPIPDVPIADLIAPRGIDFRHTDYTVMDGLYYTHLYIKGNGYPTVVRGGWMSSLLYAGQGVDVDLFLHREERGRAVERVAQKIRLNRAKYKDMQDTGTDYEEMTNSIDAGYYIKDGIANGDDLFYISVILTVTAGSLEELRLRKGQTVDLLRSLDMEVADCRFRETDAMRSVMPLSWLAPDIEKSAHRNLLTDGAASAYPWIGFDLSDAGGVLLGVDRYHGSICSPDLFQTKRYQNGNLNIIGTSGAGKTFAMQLLAMRMRLQGIQCFLLVPIKGHEFSRACQSIGGSFIRLCPGSGHCINIMEIRPTHAPRRNPINGGEGSGQNSPLARKLQQLEVFFSLLVPDMTGEEAQALDEALLATYADFGITHAYTSLYADASHTVPKPMPILGDLYKRLQKKEDARRVALSLRRFVSGSAQSFNRQTNVKLDSGYTVLDLSDLDGKLLPLGLMIALDLVWDQVKSDIVRKKAVFIDEIWQLVGAGSNPRAAAFCLQLFKTIRGYGGIAVAATQDLSDFFGLEGGKYGKAILNSSQTKLILRLEAKEADEVREVLKLTDPEAELVTCMARGEALLCSGNDKIPISIRASALEKELITTDREDLVAMVKKYESNSVL